MDFKAEKRIFVTAKSDNQLRKEYCAMTETSLKTYAAPAFRFLRITEERSFLQTNTEPIEGGNDPDIDW